MKMYATYTDEIIVLVFFKYPLAIRGRRVFFLTKFQMDGITENQIIDIVCTALKLDRETLISNHRKRICYDAKTIAVILIREKVKKSKPTKVDPDKTKSPTYKEIAYIFKHKQHGTVIDAEIEGKKLLKTDKTFKTKYDMVVDLLNYSTNIA
jgi:chromosomal replication initiation ATPase DnaA